MRYPRAVVRGAAALLAVAMTASLGTAHADEAFTPVNEDAEQVVATDPQAALASAAVRSLVGDERLALPYPERRYRPHLCDGGAPSCVDAVISRMVARTDALAATCHHDAPFSLLYQRTTEAVRAALQRGVFDDPSLVNKQTTVFADMYFSAAENWRQGRIERVPPAWRLTFAAAERSQVSGQGDALLGMASHILADLPYAIASVPELTRKDHLAVNEVLAEVYEPVVAEEARRFDPTMRAADPLPGSLDQKPVLEVLFGWREEAWQAAARLRAATDDEARAAVVADIERRALRTAEQLYLATRYASSSQTKIRDDYCAVHGQS